MIQDDVIVIDQTLQKLQRSFREGKTRPIQFRKEQLNNLLKAFNENILKIHNAMNLDLGYQNIGSSKLLGISGTVKLIEYNIKNIDEWTKERPVHSNLMVGTANCKIIPEPYGCSLVIGSWNYPFYTTISPAIEAISAGNCVCLKPSELSPNCSNLIKELFEKYMDSSCYQVIEGQVEVSKSIITKKWDQIIFTGSPDKGKIIAKAAAENLIPCILELGGKSPTIIDKCANIENAALRITSGKYSNCGQTCIAPDYVFCHEDNVDKFIDATQKAIKKFYSDEIIKSKDYVRIITQFHTQRIIKMLDQQNHQGQIIIGGKHDVSQKFVEPTVILNPKLESQMMQEEIFGPILPILTYKDLNDVIDHINKNHKPLALYYFGENKQNRQTIEYNTSSGSFVQNDCIIQILNPLLPFGGVGNSGQSQLHGLIGFNNCSHLKPVMYADTNNKYPNNIRFPPLTEKNGKFLDKAVKFGNVFPGQIIGKVGKGLGWLTFMSVIVAGVLYNKKQ